MWMLKIRLASSSNYVCTKTFGLSFVVFGDVGFVNKLMLLVHFLCVFTCTVGEYSTLGLTIFRGYMR